MLGETVICAPAGMAMPHNTIRAAPRTHGHEHARVSAHSTFPPVATASDKLDKEDVHTSTSTEAGSALCRASAFKV